jgi:CheY-like chemotaxis protein
MDGFELVRRIRQDRRLFRIPVIAVSALASEADYRRTLEAGFSGHLAKPITFGVVEAQLRRVFSSRTH